MRRDTPPRRQAGQAVAGSLGAGSKRSGSRVGRREAAANHLVANALRCSDGPHGHSWGLRGDGSDNLVAADLRNGTLDEVAQTMQSGGADGERGLSINSVPHVMAFGGNNTEGPIEVATARNGHAGPHGRCDFESETFIAFSCKDHGADAQTDHAPTMRAMGHDGSHANAGGQLAVAHALRADSFDASEDGTGRATPIVPLVAGTMPAAGATENKHGMGWGQQEWESGYAIPVQVHGAHGSNGAGIGEVGDPAMTLQADIQQAVAFQAKASSQQSFNPSDVAPSLDVGKAGGMSVATAWAVRRLTPYECELLMGYEGEYTLISYRGKPAADGPRYKALGNSMAVPVMRWIGQRIELFEQITGEVLPARD